MLEEYESILRIYQSKLFDIKKLSSLSSITLFKYELRVAWSIRANSKIKSTRSKFINKDYWGKKPDD